VPSAPAERKLAAILSADVVGYSRLMAEDEAGTIQTLTDYREEIAMLVRQHRGRLADFTGAACARLVAHQERDRIRRLP
jgi:class 3 adenylate cyclase